jgi:translation initiation factor 2B subunit (eIF-2B alpha/beta/delta family)
VLTLSHSGTVARVVVALQRERRLEVVCGEGRPRFEGRQMAEALARHGMQVTLTTDAAVTSFLEPTAAVVVGADALAADYWINKVGTAGLTAAAAARGVPVYVVATRDKALAQPLAARWNPGDGPAEEVMAEPPRHVSIRNPYFEPIPIEQATLVLTDVGPVPPGEVGALATRYLPDVEALLGIVG